MDKDSIATIAVEYCWSMKELSITLEEAILKTIEFVKKSLPGGSDVDMEWIKEYLRLSVTQEVSDYLMLKGEDQERKKKWWTEQKNDNPKQHWSRWRRYLTKVKKWSPAVIDSLDQTTDKILDAIDDPKESLLLGDRRGLVLGYVQSGKTAHYTGLINKALDAKFQLIIILAGMHDSLRMQTQARLDEEVFGCDSSVEAAIKNGMFKELIGVGKLASSEELMVNMYTNRDKKGDFKKNQANKIQPLGGRPAVFIVKKNATILKNLYQFFRTGNLTKDHLLKQGKAVIANISMLMIDDEADQASINTNSISDSSGNILPEYEPSRVNAEIRRIYNLFSNKAYIGYTATPYANIFINDEAETEKYGKELFPKDFILCLPKPSNYIGPAEFFGLNRDDGESMPLVREIHYDPLFVPAKAKKDHIPQLLPETLLDAIGSFLISSAIRFFRKQEKEHMSMLIHAARFTDIHKEIKELVIRKVESIKNRIRYEDIDDPNSFIVRLRSIWENDFVKTSNKMREFFSELSGIYLIPEWSEVYKGIISVLEKLEVLEVNGVSNDELNYKDFPDGRIVIAVGGDKLSRGLTLEGLSVSYFLRASNFYDTLMQMGRWFGYRPGYLDLCRLFTTPILSEWFSHIAVATEELRSELFDMDQREALPNEYGLKVRTHSELCIAAENKMQSSFEMQEDYSNCVSETTKFDNDEDFYRGNLSALEHFIQQLGAFDRNYLYKKRPKKYKPSSNTPRHYFWENIDGFSICNFLSEYKTAKNAPRANSHRLREYISKQIEHGGLTNWTVCLINTDDDRQAEEKGFEIGGLPIQRGVIRAKNGQSDKIGTKAFGRLLSQEHEYFDLDDDQIKRVNDLKVKATKKKEGKRAKIIMDSEGNDWEAATYIRREIRKDQPHKGLLLIYPIAKSKDSAFSNLSEDIIPIGIGIVFPPSHFTTPVSYMVNNVFHTLEEEDEEV